MFKKFWEEFHLLSVKECPSPMLSSEKNKEKKSLNILTDETLLVTFYKSEHFDSLSLQVGPFYCPQSIRCSALSAVEAHSEKHNIAKCCTGQTLCVNCNVWQNFRFVAL